MSFDTGNSHQRGHRSSFLCLPREVRQIIYRYVFSDSSVEFLPCDGHGELTNMSMAMSILFVNKLCYGEAKYLFYNHTRFHLKLCRDKSCTPSSTKFRERFGDNAQHVNHIYYSGLAPKDVSTMQTTFPNLKLFEMFLCEDFYHSDQTNFDRAMRYVLRYAEWKCAIKSALDDRFAPEMRDLVAHWQRLGPKRGFAVKLYWSMAYRFVDFVSYQDFWRNHWKDEADMHSAERLTSMSGSCACGILNSSHLRCTKYLKIHWSPLGPRADLPFQSHELGSKEGWNLDRDA